MSARKVGWLNPRIALIATLLGSVPLSGALGPAVAAAAPAPAGRAESAPAPADTSLTLKGGQPGTALGSMTVEEENRIRVEFQRPDLQIELDPRQAPGLTWGSPVEVLQRSVPDMVGPFLAASASVRTPYAPHPWLTGFRLGNVVRFTPRLTEVDRWKLTVVDSRGQMVAEFAGEKKPPQEILWDGRAKDGTPCLPGLTYSYMLEAYDRAGNVRRFAGEGFQIPPYRYVTGNDQTFLFAARPLGAGALAGGSPAGAASGDPGDATLVHEAASRLNLGTRPTAPVRVVAVARSLGEADQLAQRVGRELQPLLQGEPARVAVTTRVETGAPEAGAVLITTAAAPAARAAAQPESLTPTAAATAQAAQAGKTPALPPPRVRK
jgi:hypothetical protein